MNKYKRRVFASFLVGVMTLASLEAAAADPDTHPLSREHVNLVRVQGQKITDVVYDTQALEITADKARGIVFVKVRPSWLATGANDVTSAFFNTESENFAVQFLVSAVPSQTVDLTPQTTTASGTAATETKIALAAPLLRLEAGDFVAELKQLAQRAFDRQTPSLDSALAALSAGEEATQFAAVPAPEGSVVWEGFRVREIRAFVTADKLVETLLFTRISPKASVPDAARLAQGVSGVLAVAQEIGDESRDRLQTEITLVRSREAAVRGEDFFESALSALSSAKTDP